MLSPNFGYIVCFNVIILNQTFTWAETSITVSKLCNDKEASGLTNEKQNCYELHNIYIYLRKTKSISNDNLLVISYTILTNVPVIK